MGSAQVPKPLPHEHDRACPTKRPPDFCGDRHREQRGTKEGGPHDSLSFSGGVGDVFRREERIGPPGLHSCPNVEISGG